MNFSVKQKMIAAYYSIVVMAISFGLILVGEMQKEDRDIKLISDKNFPASNSIEQIKFSFLDKLNSYLEFSKGDFDKGGQIWDRAENILNTELVSLRNLSVIENYLLDMIEKSNNQLNEIRDAFLGLRNTNKTTNSIDNNLLFSSQDKSKETIASIKPLLDTAEIELIRKVQQQLRLNEIKTKNIFTIFIFLSALGTLLLTLLLFILIRNIITPIKELVSVTEAVAKGDLKRFAYVKNKDEIGVLASSFNSMIKGLGDVLAKMQDAVNQISSASKEILAANHQQVSGAREQSVAISETTSAAKQLSKSAEQVGENVKKVSQVASHVMSGMVKIKDLIGKTGKIVTSLNEKSQKIGKITEVIDDVADQTNLLAVNASIEAARAGEQGRGFTVVADEIRKLADSTARSTKDITDLIEIIQHEMTNAIMSMEESIKSVEEEVKLSQDSSERVKEIFMSTTQQVSGSKQIAEAMVSIDEAMKQIAQAAQQSQIAAKQLTDLAQELKDTSGNFKAV